MEQVYHINGHPVKVMRSIEENSFVSRQLNFIGESDASFYLPMEDGVSINKAEKYLNHLAEHYAGLMEKSFQTIGQEALKGGYWGKALSEHPTMDLVWIRVIKPSEKDNICLDLAFNDAEHDVYTLWIASFTNSDLTSVRRQAW